MSGWRTLFPNAWYVALREFRARARTRSFVIGTVMLAFIAFAATQLPVLIDYSMTTSQARIAVVVKAAKLPADAASLFDVQLNGQATSSGSTKAFVVSWQPGSEDAVRKDLQNGRYDALLVIDRDSVSGNLTFTLQTDSPADGSVVTSIDGALQLMAIEDRIALTNSSIADVVRSSSPQIIPIHGTAGSTNSISREVSANVLSTGLIVLIFMAIITYGQWVAMSVAEEKGSRVMELMLNATTPLQMLAGKVIGNGAAGLMQYGIILAAVVGGLIAQGPIHQAVVGTPTGAPFGGMDPTVLAAFAVLFVLGFLLYSLLYAALGSLVSRQEDVQSAVTPLTMLVMVGYFLSIFGLQAIDDSWVRIASFVPFFSPYLMLARVSLGHVALWEFALSAVILLATIAVALFVAARIYSAGVLLYGQRVSLRQVFMAARISR
jgi:ABC-2 type transport system permease protein